MSYFPTGYPSGYPTGGGFPPYGQPPYGQPNPMFNVMMCMQPIGLGGKQQMIPIQRPIDLQPVVQQVVMYLMSQGFQVYPMVGQNMAVIQAQHTSLLGYLTDSNKAYTIRICEGPNMIMVETGLTNLLQDLIPLIGSAGLAYFSDTDLHNALLTAAGGGVAALDTYNLIKDIMQEDQIMNMIMMAIMTAESTAPPYPQQTPQYPQTYPQQQQPTSPQTVPQSQYPQPSTQPQYSTQPSQSVSSPSAVSPQVATLQTQIQKTTKKCWKCGAEIDSNAKYCPYCGASQTPIKCPKCGYLNSPGAKYCSQCGAPLS